MVAPKWNLPEDGISDELPMDDQKALTKVFGRLSDERDKIRSADSSKLQGRVADSLIPLLCGLVKVAAVKFELLEAQVAALMDNDDGDGGIDVESYNMIGDALSSAAMVIQSGIDQARDAPPESVEALRSVMDKITSAQQRLADLGGDEDDEEDEG